MKLVVPMTQVVHHSNLVPRPFIGPGSSSYVSRYYFYQTVINFSNLGTGDYDWSLAIDNEMDKKI